MECMETNPVPEDWLTTYPESGRRALKRDREDGVMEVLELPYRWPHRLEILRAMLGSDWNFAGVSEGDEVYLTPQCE